MPLAEGSSKKVISRNIAELVASTTQAGRARRHHGRKKAREIAVAIALDKARRSAKRSHK